jgi:hypothetical protein
MPRSRLKPMPVSRPGFIQFQNRIHNALDSFSS